MHNDGETIIVRPDKPTGKRRQRKKGPNRIWTRTVEQCSAVWAFAPRRHNSVATSPRRATMTQQDQTRTDERSCSLQAVSARFGRTGLQGNRRIARLRRGSRSPTRVVKYPYQIVRGVYRLLRQVSAVSRTACAWLAESMVESYCKADLQGGER